MAIRPSLPLDYLKVLFVPHSQAIVTLNTWAAGCFVLFCGMSCFVTLTRIVANTRRGEKCTRHDVFYCALREVDIAAE